MMAFMTQTGRSHYPPFFHGFTLLLAEEAQSTYYTAAHQFWKSQPSTTRLSQSTPYCAALMAEHVRAPGLFSCCPTAWNSLADILWSNTEFW